MREYTEKSCTAEAKQYFRKHRQEGSFGGFFESEQAADADMENNNYSAVTARYWPCILNRRSQNNLPTLQHIYAKKYAPNVIGGSPISNHVTVIFRG